MKAVILSHEDGGTYLLDRNGDFRFVRGSLALPVGAEVDIWSSAVTRFIRTAILAACFLLTLSVGGFSYAWNQNSFSVFMEINPGLELVFNNFDRLIKTLPLNQDGAELLDGLPLKGKADRVVVDVLLEAERKGYLDPGSGEAGARVTVLSKNNRDVSARVRAIDDALSAANLRGLVTLETGDKRFRSLMSQKYSTDEVIVSSRFPASVSAPPESRQAEAVVKSEEPLSDPGAKEEKDPLIKENVDIIASQVPLAGGAPGDGPDTSADGAGAGAQGAPRASAPRKGAVSAAPTTPAASATGAGSEANPSETPVDAGDADTGDAEGIVTEGPAINKPATDKPATDKPVSAIDPGKLAGPGVSVPREDPLKPPKDPKDTIDSIDDIDEDFFGPRKPDPKPDDDDGISNGDGTKTIYLKSGAGGGDDVNKSWANAFYVGALNQGEEKALWRLTYTGDLSSVISMRLEFTNGEIFDWTPDMGFSADENGSGECWVIIGPSDWVLNNAGVGGGKMSACYIIVPDTGKGQFNLNG